jgi:hypothetical protein
MAAGTNPLRERQIGMRVCLFIIVTGCLCVPGQAAEQWAVQFAVERKTFVHGEPIVLSASIGNVGKTKQTVYSTSGFFEYSADGKTYKKIGYSKQEEAIPRGSSLEAGKNIQLDVNGRHGFSRRVFAFLDHEGRTLKSIRPFFVKPGRYWIRAGYGIHTNPVSLQYSEPVQISIESSTKSDIEASKLFFDKDVLLVVHFNGSEVYDVWRQKLVRGGLEKAVTITRKHPQSVYAAFLKAVANLRVQNLKEIAASKQRAKTAAPRKRQPSNQRAEPARKRRSVLID